MHTDRYTQVSTVFLPKSSAKYHLRNTLDFFVLLLPRDRRFRSTKHLADEHCRLTFGNLSDGRQSVDEARWLRYATDHMSH